MKSIDDTSIPKIVGIRCMHIVSKTDRFSFAMLNSLPKRAINYLTIVKPETVLDWQRRFIKKRWSYKHKTPGRKPVSKDLRKLILEMKQDNPTWFLVVNLSDLLLGYAA